MLYILGNRYLKENCQRLENSIPNKVIKTADMILEVLEDNYNCGNMPFMAGGYVVLISGNQKGIYEKLLYQYRITPDMAEYKEIILEENGTVWYQEYYQLATEYGIVVIFCAPDNKTEIEE